MIRLFGQAVEREGPLLIKSRGYNKGRVHLSLRFVNLERKSAEPSARHVLIENPDVLCFIWMKGTRIDLLP